MMYQPSLDHVTLRACSLGGISNPTPAVSSLPKLHDCGNLLLDRLPQREFDRLTPSLQLTTLSIKQVVQESGVEVGYVYFPITSLISLLTVLEDDDPIEVTTVGREGVAGVSVILGLKSSVHRAICQMGGDALRIQTPQFVAAMGHGGAFRQLVTFYSGYLLRDISQTVACNALHVIESRACRWLLMMHDQARDDKFGMTHEFMASMLGVRRQTVTVVMGTLQASGLLRIRRGAVQILDRQGLEEAACECYVSARDAYHEIMSS